MHLLLQKHLGGDAARAWVMTKPDRTRFFFDSDGYSSAVVDRNGNTQTFTYEQRRSANQPDKFLRYVGLAGEASLDDHASTSFSEMCHAVVGRGPRQCCDLGLADYPGSMAVARLRVAPRTGQRDRMERCERR